jgi:hypothetical protein
VSADRAASVQTMREPNSFTRGSLGYLSTFTVTSCRQPKHAASSDLTPFWRMFARSIGWQLGALLCQPRVDRDLHNIFNILIEVSTAHSSCSLLDVLLGGNIRKSQLDLRLR